MKTKIHFLLMCIGYLPIASYAQMTNLVCLEKDTNFTVPIGFDEKRQLVRFAEREIPATINERLIIFTSHLGKDKKTYQHRISRDTGVMTVADQTGFIFSYYDCSTARKKF